jgi:hydrogenase nickel incorporation protein HypA/HybF
LHELSIAQAIVEVADSEARKAKATRVARVVVEVGGLSGIIADSLEFCFPMACDSTLVEGAELCIEHVDPRGWCQACEREFAMQELLDTCPSCGGFAAEICAGQELKVLTIDVE